MLQVLSKNVARIDSGQEVTFPLRNKRSGTRESVFLRLASVEMISFGEFFHGICRHSPFDILRSSVLVEVGRFVQADR
tara:strand:- start:28 stop:261 length:234 start_codon:yes stop_codon:yes gene_type:complete